MQKAVMTLSPRDTLRDAVTKMAAHRISCVVVTKDDQPIRLISERTVVNSVAADLDLDTPIYKVPRGPCLMVAPTDRVTVILKRMRRLHVRRAMVIFKKKLVGLVTQTTLLEAYQRILDDVSLKSDKLADKAEHDELTWLYNRHYLKDAFGHEISRVRRYGGLLALVMFDLDHFKSINDQYGHNAGDAALRTAGHIMQKAARGADIVARYGGEEFAVLMPAAGTRAARIYAERVRQRLSARDFKDQDATFSLTVSAGICKWSRELNTMRKMIEAADKALYRAKRTGRNRVRLHR
jgi:diguanylate cyclase (GGDEF)-like protein